MCAINHPLNTHASANRLATTASVQCPFSSSVSSKKTKLGASLRPGDFFPLKKTQSFFFSPEKRENPLKRDLRTQGTHCWILKDEWDWIILSELKFPITAGACFPSGHVTILGYGLYPEIYKKGRYLQNYISDSWCSFSANGLVNVVSADSSLTTSSVASVVSAVSDTAGSE